MSCNILEDNRIQFKTNLPSLIGDFWLSKGSEKAKDIVRLFTRLSTQNYALSYIDYAENLLSVTTPHINGLPRKIKVSDVTVEFRNFNHSNYSTTAHNGFPVEIEIPLRKQDSNREGVYLLDPETRKIWQDVSGSYWIWCLSKDPENSLNPYGEDFVLSDTIFIRKQPEYAIEFTGVVPTMILSKKGYLLYGLNFRVETGYIIFNEPLESLFENYIHIQACYEKRKTLLGFPFSIDPETPGVEHISKFVRYNSSAKNLEKALSQVVGYTSVPKISVAIKKEIPEGTVMVDITGNMLTTTQEYTAISHYEKDDFPGKPITVMNGVDEDIINFITTKSNFKLKSPIGEIILQDKDYACNKSEDNFVEIDLGSDNNSLYLNSLRKSFEKIPRYDQHNEQLPTFSEYLINKYSEGADTFYVPLLKEFMALFGQSLLFILFSPGLNLEQRQAAIDFLETHTPANAIILTDTIWE